MEWTEVWEDRVTTIVGCYKHSLESGTNSDWTVMGSGALKAPRDLV
jgi:hypothetical protein